MAGHSKWANIKHRKGAQDAKRAKAFTKVAREIMVAARESGGDPNTNPRLRAAIASARQVNMPNDKIDKAIKKGTGDSDGQSFEEIVYEGYGPAGVAVWVQVLTDNRNRTGGEIRSIFSKSGGELGAPNSVAWMFERKGYIEVEKDKIDEEALMDLALEAGAGDIVAGDEVFEVTSAPEDFNALRDALEEKGVEMRSAESTMLPQNMTVVEGEKAAQVIALLEKLEDNDDVQKVCANCDIQGDPESA